MKEVDEATQTIVVVRRSMVLMFLSMLFLIQPFTVFSSAMQTYCYRVYLTPQVNQAYSTERPEEYLSPEAIERRVKHGVPITHSDFPIVQHSLDSLVQTGSRIVVQSRWRQTVVVENKDSLIIDQLRQLSFVDSVRLVWHGKDRDRVYERDETTSLFTDEEEQTDYYGYAKGQIEMLDGVRLHKKGFKGEGVRIAVIDAGFENVDRLQAFDSLKLIGTKNFISPTSCVFSEDDHGTKVLSCMAANLPGIMVGAAPEASYLLLKTEDERSEFPIEEDYWTAAVEYADSLGIDIITTSLGYFRFDLPDPIYSTDDLDGQTSYITQTANVAAEKGLILFCSAGNEGDGSWEKIVFPSDGSQLITVGSVNKRGKVSSFSSKGFTSDYRIKPDLVAMGSFASVIDPSGEVRFANGTSFATPVLAGLGACLYQLLPWLTPQKFIDLMKRSAHQFDRPDAEMGYGIPNVYKIFKQQQKHAFRK